MERITYISGNGAWTMFLAKYDVNGNFQWAELNSASPNTVGHAVAVDVQDNAYTVGLARKATTFFSADGHDITITGFSPGQSDGNYPERHLPGQVRQERQRQVGESHWRIQGDTRRSHGGPERRNQPCRLHREHQLWIAGRGPDHRQLAASGSEHQSGRRYIH